MKPTQPGRRAAWLAGLCLAGLAPVAAAQNQVANAQFDNGLTGWTSIVGIASVDNNQGSPTAPSLQLLPDSANQGPPSAELQSDCIAVDASQNYDLIVDMMQAPDGVTMAEALAYSDASCSSALGSAATVETFGGDPVGNGWVRSSNLGFALPQGTAGVRVSLKVDGTFNSGGFDWVQFGLAGTTPVTLQSFEVE